MEKDAGTIEADDKAGRGLIRGIPDSGAIGPDFGGAGLGFVAEGERQMQRGGFGGKAVLRRTEAAFHRARVSSVEFFRGFDQGGVAAGVRQKPRLPENDDENRRRGDGGYAAGAERRPAFREEPDEKDRDERDREAGEHQKGSQIEKEHCSFGENDEDENKEGEAFEPFPRNGFQPPAPGRRTAEEFVVEVAHGTESTRSAETGQPRHAQRGRPCRAGGIGRAAAAAVVSIPP